MPTLMTVWFIVLVSSNGHRIELPGRFDNDKQCYAAAAELQQGHPGASATCVTQQVPDPRGSPWTPPQREGADPVYFLVSSRNPTFRFGSGKYRVAASSSAGIFRAKFLIPPSSR